MRFLMTRLSVLIRSYLDPNSKPNRVTQFRLKLGPRFGPKMAKNSSKKNRTNNAGIIGLNLT